MEEMKNEPLTLIKPEDFVKCPLSLCKGLYQKLPDCESNMDILDPFTGEGEWFSAIRIINREVNYWSAGTDRCAWNGVKIDEHHIDWIVCNPPEYVEGENGFIKTLHEFAGRTTKGLALLIPNNMLKKLQPVFLEQLYTEKGMYMWKIVVCRWKGKPHYFCIFKNRCCKNCSLKDEGCCPDEYPVDEKEEMPHHRHNIGNKPRFDFFDYLEGEY